MSILHVNHIQADCRTRFISTIDMSDVQNASPADKDDMFLSRALAAFSIAAVAKVSDAVAAASVVDQYHDDGIDAFYYDTAEHVAYLVQSKWIKNGTSSVDLGATLKFQQGINPPNRRENRIVGVEDAGEVRRYSGCFG